MTISSTTSPLLSKKRRDYTPPSHTIETVDLRFELSPQETKVTAVSTIKRIDTQSSVLFLDGKDLCLQSIKIDDQILTENDDYKMLDNGLELYTSLATFTLTVVNTIKPIENTSLEGLYYSNNAYCSQCEAEGFRKITYFLDRPDVLAIFTVSIVSTAEADTYLLSNGNLITDTGFENGERTCVWEDPFPKPSYLFALVAGHFDKLVDEFTTQSGKKIALELFVDEGRLGQGQHALDSLKKAMSWDEQNYGLEYDLDIYMIVAVDFFNMGAMENKGLNVFNSKFVLADAHTATDEDYFNVEAVIAHEYFHNWTGNRVTCRDWFQLSLKEGLTVFRDQQFSADMYSDLVTRISHVNVMRENQFAEDAGPMSHPIRPDEVVEMSNFYTVTVYNKGAEVIRMLHTLLGKAGFRKGMDEYFARHDGQAVTCDDFVNAMQDANGADLSHFKRWYSQSGTPRVRVEQASTGDSQTTLSFTQINTPTRTQAQKQDLYVPIKLECFDKNGHKVDTRLKNDTLVMNSASTALVLDVPNEQITPSLLQDFSAPVLIEYDYTLSQLLIIIEFAGNDYAKWEASHNAYIMLIKEIYNAANGANNNADMQLRQDIEKLATAIKNLTVAPEVLAQILSVPSAESLYSQIEKVDPIMLYHARHKVVVQLSNTLHHFCIRHYLRLSQNPRPYAYEKQQVNNRSLKNTCLHLLAHSSAETVAPLIALQYKNAHNMSDRLGALKAAQVTQDDTFDSLMIAFEEQFGDDAVVMDKWFAMQAKSSKTDILAHLDLLQAHQQYSIKNPNKVRSLIGSFAFYNTLGFHQIDGSGYKYLTDYLITLDKVNPQIASRLMTPLMQFSRYASTNQVLIKAQLNRLYGVKGLSKDLFEKISKALIM
ncbi:aminopeptidase N [Glaciecola punicea ACAM 611]|jgi:aminopeptidase N|uniref:Aminopeptidase N n=1 Tax=Glaciecola punicea ACAM 611 TaxID=1121923 RepID=H5T9F8_9ALTE|nr:aminopeptidase N [Glaciecola punicea]OFA33204.1 aminopeptidase N [Glaciecola punicea]GAB54935.1 aminopeptidase N [Glaciecola punicea ACAM 611]